MQDRNWDRLCRHVLSNLACLGRHTLTGIICTSGMHSRDWTSEYRLYSKERVDPTQLFDTIRKTTISGYDQQVPLIAALDDTLLPKCGKRTPGVSYRRDPLGPPFNLNLIKAHRTIQVSMAYPGENGTTRMIPIDFRQAPSAKKPGRRASAEAHEYYKEEKKKLNLSRQGLKSIVDLRKKLDIDVGKNRPLWMTVDGSYTNRNVLKDLPENVVLIGRIRKDTKFYYPVENNKSVGRNKVYGERAPTPHELLYDNETPYRKVKAFYAGKMRDFNVKTISPLKWRVAGKNYSLRMLVIGGIKYQIRKDGSTSRKGPAYLICTDHNIPEDKILQAYLQRWDIEVNFREEKSILGLGQAQVRNPKSVDAFHSTAVASYALLLLAGIRSYGKKGFPSKMPSPKWQRKNGTRPTLSNMLSHLRWELWSTAISSVDFYSFKTAKTTYTKPEKLKMPLSTALFLAKP